MCLKNKFLIYWKCLFLCSSLFDDWWWTWLVLPDDLCIWRHKGVTLTEWFHPDVLVFLLNNEPVLAVFRVVSRLVCRFWVGLVDQILCCGFDPSRVSLYLLDAFTWTWMLLCGRCGPAMFGVQVRDSTLCALFRCISDGRVSPSCFRFRYLNHRLVRLCKFVI